MGAEKKPTYTKEQRDTVLLSVPKEGVCEAARKHGVSQGTVSRWAREAGVKRNGEEAKRPAKTGWPFQVEPEAGEQTEPQKPPVPVAPPPAAEPPPPRAAQRVQFSSRRGKKGSQELHPLAEGGDLGGRGQGSGCRLHQTRGQPILNLRLDEEK